MNDEPEPVRIDGEGMIATLVALIGYLEGLEVMTRAEFATTLRGLSYDASTQVAPQLLAMSELICRSPVELTVHDGGKADNDDGPDAA